MKIKSRQWLQRGLILTAISLLAYASVPLLYMFGLSGRAATLLEEALFGNAVQHWQSVLSSPPRSLLECDPNTHSEGRKSPLPSFMFFEDVEGRIKPFFPLYLQDTIIDGDLLTTTARESQYQIRADVAIKKLRALDPSILMTELLNYSQECPSTRDGIVYYSFNQSIYSTSAYDPTWEPETWRQLFKSNNSVYRLLATHFAVSWVTDNEDLIGIVESVLAEESTIFHVTILTHVSRAHIVWSRAESESLKSILRQFIDSPKADRNDGTTIDAESRRITPRFLAELLYEKLQVKPPES